VSRCEEDPVGGHAEVARNGDHRSDHCAMASVEFDFFRHIKQSLVEILSLCINEEFELFSVQSLFSQLLNSHAYFNSIVIFYAEVQLVLARVPDIRRVNLLLSVVGNFSQTIKLHFDERLVELDIL
jgi:hypothetical protein